MADIFREIDEELQQERAAKLWKRYGPYVVALAVLVVAGIAGYRFWMNWQAEQRADQSNRYELAAALAKKDPASAIAQFGELADKGDAGYATLAQLRQAAVAAETGDVEAAVIVYRKIASEEKAPKLLRDLGRLLAVTHLIDTGDPAALAAEIAPLADGAGPWQPLAREARALIALKAGETDKAREILKGLSDDANAPSQLRARAGELLAAIGQ